MSEIKNSEGIYYINDSSLDFAVRLVFSQLSDFIDLAINNIPQHHYIFDKAMKWCLVISSEGFIDFGLSKVKNQMDVNIA